MTINAAVRATRTRKKKATPVDAEVEEQKTDISEGGQRLENGSKQKIVQRRSEQLDEDPDVDAYSSRNALEDDINTAYDEFTALPPDPTQRPPPEGEAAVLTQEEYERMIDLPLVSHCHARCRSHRADVRRRPVICCHLWIAHDHVFATFKLDKVCHVEVGSNLTSLDMIRGMTGKFLKLDGQVVVAPDIL